MKYRELKPLTDRPAYWERVELEIRQLFRKEIYLKLMHALGEESTTLQNSKDSDLARAVAQGKIQYVKGHFEGKFDASTSKALKGLGAQWDRTQGRWKIPRQKLPPDVNTAIGTSYSRFQRMSQRVDKTLQEILPEEVASKLSLEKAVDRTLYDVGKDFDASVSKVAVAPKFTEGQKKRISENYNDNMRLYIKEWTQDEIKKLRSEVSDNALEGYRYEGLVKTIQKSYGVSQNKARFLARQETSLLVAQFREQRYRDVGVTRYRWRCTAGSPNHPVRPMHKALDGTIQTWDSPPVVDKLGNRKHPGQDYNCRCIAIPLVGTA